MFDKPALTIVAGASYVKVQKRKKNKTENAQAVEDVELGKKVEKKANNKRGSVIREFSREARTNMLYTMSRIKRDSLPCFVTLTYGQSYNADAKVWKNDLHSFALRLHRAFPDFSGIWKLEPQRRGAPHYHLLIWGVSCQELRAFVPAAWHEVIKSDDPNHLSWHMGLCGNGNIHCVQEVSTPKAMYQYVIKYINKASTEGWKNVGKWWGIFWKEKLPFGEEVVFEITDEKALEIMRYMRRFTRRSSRNLQSRQICCDANHWMEKLQTKPIGGYREWLERLKELELGMQE
jgi:hypothetical protein